MKKLLTILFLLSSYSFGMQYEDNVNEMLNFADAYEQFKVHLLETPLPIYDVITRTKSFEAFLTSAKAAPDDINAMREALNSNWYTQLGISELDLREALLPLIEEINEAKEEEKVKIVKEALSRYTLSRITPKKMGIANSAVNRKQYSIDGRNIILEYSDTALMVFDDQTLRIKIANEYTTNITAVELSPDGKHIAIASNNRVTIFNAVKAQIIKLIAGYSEPVTTLSWNPQADRLAMGCHNGFVVVFNLDVRKVTGSCKAGVPSLDSMSWSSNGKYIAAASKATNKCLGLIDCNGAFLGPIFIDQKFRSQSMVFWHNRKPYFLFYMPLYANLYEVCSMGDLFIWDIIEKKQVAKWEYAQFMGLEDRLIADSVTLDTDYGIFTFSDRFFNLEECIFTEYALFTTLYSALPYSKTKIINSEPLERIFWQRDKYITINNTSIKIIDKKTDQENYAFEAESRISAHEICGNKLIVAEENKKVHILDTTVRSVDKAAHPILSIATPTTLIRSFKNKDQDYIAIRSDYHVVTIYNMHGELLHSINHGEFIYELFCKNDKSSDEVELLVASRNALAFWALNERLSLKNSIRIESNAIIKSESSGYWVIDQGRVTKLSSEETKIQKPSKNLSSPIACLAENSSGDVALADERGFLRIYTRTGYLQHEFKAHVLPIVSMHWLNSSTLITSSQDHTAKIWIMGTLVETISGTGGVNAISNIDIYDQWSVDTSCQPQEIKFESLPGSYRLVDSQSRVEIERTQPMMPDVYQSNLPLSRLLLFYAYSNSATSFPTIALKELVESANTGKSYGYYIAPSGSRWDKISERFMLKSKSNSYVFGRNICHLFQILPLYLNQKQLFDK